MPKTTLYQCHDNVRRFISAERTIMDYGKNLKYFNSTDKLFYIGLPILIVGALLVVCELLWFFFIPYQMLIGLAIAVLGAALAFVPRSLRASEKDLDAIVSAKFKLDDFREALELHMAGTALKVVIED